MYKQIASVLVLLLGLGYAQSEAKGCNVNERIRQLTDIFFGTLQMSNGAQLIPNFFVDPNMTFTAVAEYCVTSHGCCKITGRPALWFTLLNGKRYYYDFVSITVQCDGSVKALVKLAISSIETATSIFETVEFVWARMGGCQYKIVSSNAVSDACTGYAPQCITCGFPPTP